MLDVIQDEEGVENLRCWHKTQATQELELNALAPPQEPKDGPVRVRGPSPRNPLSEAPDRRPGAPTVA